MLGRVLEALESGPNAPYTDILLWSDHGYHLDEKLHVAKRTLWEQSTRVPLIIRSPATRPGEVEACPVSLVDLAPTILHMAGLTERERAGFDLDGTSLLEETFTPAVTMWEGAYSLRSRYWRYTRYPCGAKELYDHRIDDAALNNLAGSREHRGALVRQRKRLRELLGDILPAA